MDYLAILKIKYNPLVIVQCTVDRCNFSPSSPQQLLRHFRSKHAKNTDIQSACLHSRDCLQSNSTILTLKEQNFSKTLN